MRSTVHYSAAPAGRQCSRPQPALQRQAHGAMAGRLKSGPCAWGSRQGLARDRGAQYVRARARSSESAGQDVAIDAGLSAPSSNGSVNGMDGMDVTGAVADPTNPLGMPLETAEASVSGAAAAAGSEAESLGAQALALALLVSPFFFWGTSMVGMKVRTRLSSYIQPGTLFGGAINIKNIVTEIAELTAFSARVPRTQSICNVCSQKTPVMPDAVPVQLSRQAMGSGARHRSSAGCDTGC